MTRDQRIELQARMRSLLIQWKSSGESISAFSRRHGITPWKFQYWKARFRQQGRGKRSVFAPVHLVNDGCRGDASGIEVVLSGNAIVRVYNDASLETLRGVLLLLRERC
jgi:hypothetical protein